VLDGVLGSGLGQKFSLSDPMGLQPAASKGA